MDVVDAGSSGMMARAALPISSDPGESEKDRSRSGGRPDHACGRTPNRSRRCCGERQASHSPSPGFRVRFSRGARLNYNKNPTSALVARLKAVCAARRLAMFELIGPQSSTSPTRPSIANCRCYWQSTGRKALVDVRPRRPHRASYAGRGPAAPQWPVTHAMGRTPIETRAPQGIRSSVDADARMFRPGIPPNLLARRRSAAE